MLFEIGDLHIIYNCFISSGLKKVYRLTDVLRVQVHNEYSALAGILCPVGFAAIISDSNISYVRVISKQTNSYGNPEMVSRFFDGRLKTSDLRYVQYIQCNIK